MNKYRRAEGPPRAISKMWNGPRFKYQAKEWVGQEIRYQAAASADRKVASTTTAPNVWMFNERSMNNASGLVLKIMLQRLLRCSNTARPAFSVVDRPLLPVTLRA